MKSLLYILIALAGVTSACAQQTQTVEKFKDDALLKELNYQDSVVNKVVDGIQLKMLIVMPKEKRFKKTPVMMFVHGGGWTSGNRYVVLKKNFIQPMKMFLDSGIACVSVEYRLAKGKATAIDAVADCKDAGRYLVKHAAELGIDIDRIGVWGGSAGGHLSLMTGITDSNDFKGDPMLSNVQTRYKCIVSYYPQTSFSNKEVVYATNYLKGDKLNKILGTGVSIDSDIARKLSPAEYIKKGNPPILLIHGTADSTLSYKNSTYFIKKAKEKGTKAELITSVNAGHGGFTAKNVTPGLNEISRRTVAFICRELLN
jgi:acetyl esterase/lipase